MKTRENEAITEISFQNTLDLEDYLKSLIQTRKRKTYFFICTVNGDGTDFTQKSYHKSEISDALEYIKTNQNKRIFVPTVLFENRKRVEESIGQIRKVLIDLDLYKSKKYRDVEPKEVLKDIENRFFKNSKIPCPSAITFSGGGLYLEWHLKYTPGGKVLQKRRVIMKILYEMLKEYSPDAKSLDAPHVFSLPETINWKYGEDTIVKAYESEISDYTLADLSRMLPNLWDIWKVKKNIKVKKEKKRTLNTKNNAKIHPIHKDKTLAYDHIKSIKQLINVRHGEMTGYREMTLFFVRNAYHKMHSKRFYKKDEVLFEESLQLALEVNEMFIESLTEKEIRESTFNDEKLYRFSTDKIVEWFDITLDEQIQLKVKTLEAKREKSKRQMRQLRGSKGTMEEYQQERKESKEHLLNMVKKHLELNPNVKRQELADLLNVHPTYISKLKMEIKHR